MKSDAVRLPSRSLYDFVEGGALGTFEKRDNPARAGTRQAELSPPGSG